MDEIVKKVDTKSDSKTDFVKEDEDVQESLAKL